MNRIEIICGDPIVEKLLCCIVAELPQSDKEVVLLDAAQLARIPEFFGRKIILFSASADPKLLTEAKKTAAAGFWYLEPSAESLSRVLAGQPAFPENAPSVPFGTVGSEMLTSRELDVLRQIVSGKSDAQIAEALNCAVSTVKHHIQQLRLKSGLQNRTQMAVAAVDRGLISLERLQSCNNCTFV